jgi:hypothetical protein
MPKSVKTHANIPLVGTAQNIVYQIKLDTIENKLKGGNNG